MVGTQAGFDSLLDACGDERRCDVIGVLADRRRPTSLKDVAAAVEREAAGPFADDPGETRSRVEAELHHLHLPRLDEAGLVDYDPDERVVALTSEFYRAEPDLWRILDARPGFSVPSEV